MKASPRPMVLGDADDAPVLANDAHPLAGDVDGVDQLLKVALQDDHVGRLLGQAPCRR